MATNEPDLTRLHEDSPEELAQSVRDYFEAEVLSLDREAARIQLDNAKKANDKLEEENKDLRHDRDQRTLFSKLIFGLVTLWLAAVLAIVAVDGALVDTFVISETALTTLIGSTTASVLGLFLVVARYLFPKR